MKLYQYQKAWQCENCGKIFSQEHSLPEVCPKCGSSLEEIAYNPVLKCNYNRMSYHNCKEVVARRTLHGWEVKESIKTDEAIVEPIKEAAAEKPISEPIKNELVNEEPIKNEPETVETVLEEVETVPEETSTFKVGKPKSKIRTQPDEVLLYLRTHECITVKQAIEELGITHLPSVITYLKKQGYDIQIKWVIDQKRLPGNKGKHIEYRLAGYKVVE